MTVDLRCNREVASDLHPPTVRLKPIQTDWAAALCEGDDVFATRFGLVVEPGWEGFPDTRHVLLTAAHADIPMEWKPVLFFAEDSTLIGTGGWKGPPVDDAVELGYAVAPRHRRQGVATSVVQQLLHHAHARDVRVVLAHTLAEPNASTRVLERCGFERVAELVDPDEGAVWRWAREV